MGRDVSAMLAAADLRSGCCMRMIAVRHSARSTTSSTRKIGTPSLARNARKPDVPPAAMSAAPSRGVRDGMD
jgi:hypothetical protein